jgi:hypothetical protein
VEAYFFCDPKKSSEHLFNEHIFLCCPFVLLLWRIVNITYNIAQPTNITHMYGNGLNVIDKKTKIEFA